MKKDKLEVLKKSKNIQYVRGFEDGMNFQRKEDFEMFEKMIDEMISGLREDKDSYEDIKFFLEKLKSKITGKKI